MRTARLVGTSPSAIRLARRLRLAVSALALAVIIDLPRAFALDLDGVDGLITETVASRDRQRVWDNSKRYGAESIDERDRTFAKPEGIRAGSFLVFPEVGAAVTFDDNIFTRDFEKRSDWRSAVEGGIKFQSQLPRHMLDFSLEGKVVNYAEYTDLDYANVRAKLESALHFDNAHTLSASFLSGIEHEERDDPSYPLTARGPIQVFHNRASVGITRDVGRLYGTLSATAESWDFDDAIAVNGDQPIRIPAVSSTYSSAIRN